MIKSEELTNPASCMSRAKDDEFTFVLLGRDAATPETIRFWVKERLRLGKNTWKDEQLHEALRAAALIEAAQRSRRHEESDIARDRTEEFRPVSFPCRIIAQLNREIKPAEDDAIAAQGGCA